MRWEEPGDWPRWWVLQGTRGRARTPEGPTHEFLHPSLTAGWVSARQSSISKMSSGLRPRWAQRRDMRTEWCRSSCRAEGCWEEGLLFPSSPFSGSQPLPHSSP